MTVLENWHDNADLVGQKVSECIGESYDSRQLALYRLESGWLGWLPKRLVGEKMKSESLDDVVKRLVNKVHTHMSSTPNWNFEKTLLWFRTKNPLLGNMTPDDMILSARHRKLEKFIDNCLKESLS